MKLQLFPTQSSTAASSSAKHKVPVQAVLRLRFKFNKPSGRFDKILNYNEISNTVGDSHSLREIN